MNQPLTISETTVRSHLAENYAFASKERDTETGLNYFGARYYSSDLSIWLSVDPMVDKYPSFSPYVYCADNPIKLVDPNGEEVEYNSFVDWIVVGLTRVFNTQFNEHFKELKLSEESYVFKKNNSGKNNFTTDGEKLYINYSINDMQRREGQNIFSNMRHEATHGVQFEHGELAFANNNGIWTPTCYDIYDEYEAHNNQNSGTRLKSIPGSSQTVWHNNEKEGKRLANITALAKAYPTIDTVLSNSCVPERVKNDRIFARPYKPRQTW